MSDHIIIAGLGNHGSIYQDTRHNIGFNAIDAIADKFNFPSFTNKFSSLVSSKIIGSHKITLLKPQTYMNLSGQALSKAMHFYKLKLDDLIVIHDDLDLQFAKIKMKIGGGSGGHNGIKSIDQHLGADYYRVRIGIGKPIHTQEVSNFVLKNFTTEEQIIINRLIEDLVKNFDLMIKKELPEFMNKMAMESKEYGI